MTSVMFTGHASSGGGPQRDSYVHGAITSTPPAMSSDMWTAIGKANTFIVWSWPNYLAGLLLQASRSITRTESRPTTGLRTWNSGWRGNRKALASKTWWSSLERFYASTDNGRQLLAVIERTAA